MVSSSTRESFYSLEQLQQQLKVSLAKALYLDPSDIDSNKPFIDLGLDSIVGVEWVKAINKQYGLDMPATKVYDYSNLKQLAKYLDKELKLSSVSAVSQIPVDTMVPVSQHVTEQTVSSVTRTLSSVLNGYPVLKRKVRAAKTIKKMLSPSIDRVAIDNVTKDKVAIIGMSGRYPDANNLQQFWQNLVVGKNSIIEIPPSRWDVNQYYDPNPNKLGKIYCKWLGALDDIDCFDPLFFQITPAEAEKMDPQQRLFLQESYKAFEDAGYSGKMLSNIKCGVYLGVMSNEYSFLGYDATSTSVNITGNSFAIGVARIAYFLNLKGPAIPVDTACSSSLVAIHLACQGLINHETDMALAGGVTLYLIPDSYLGMCQAGMLSPEGQCKTFDNLANGFVPGEGVGTLVLKRLKDAQKDNDFIYGVILGSGINQDGKTNGITAPSVNSQIELERDLYSTYRIDPETISYVETHGTGTKLGDPIELEALSTVFKEKVSKKNYCALGSVKSNIGHTSGAAGVASVQKVLLSMQHKTLVPTLNVNKENTLFDLNDSPFYISRKKHAWKTSQDTLRRAAISSFGFSGTNAHLVIEEYKPVLDANHPVQSEHKNIETIILLSARTEEQLKQKASDLHEYLLSKKRSGISSENVSLIALAYTLQLGRDEMRERIGFIVNSVDQLTEKLQIYINGKQSIEGFNQGRVDLDEYILPDKFNTEEELNNKIDNWIVEGNFIELLDLWVDGAEVDWTKLYGDNIPQRTPLPTYPFAKERYWINVSRDNAPLDNKKVLNHSKKIKQEVNQRVYYYPVWIEANINTTKKEYAPEDTILVLDTTDELFKTIRENHNEKLKIASLIYIKFSNYFKKINSTCFTINPECEDDFDKLVKMLESENQFPKKIIHNNLGHEKLVEEGKIAQDINNGIYVLFYLFKALMKYRNKNPLKILSIFTDNQNASSPQKTSLAGFYKTLALENYKFQGRVIEIKNNSEKTTDSVVKFTNTKKIKIIFDEFQDANWETRFIRYIPKKEKEVYSRYVSELTSFIPKKSNITEMPIKQNGVYIISGGLGGLGYIFSEYLAKIYDARLLLIGRSVLKGSKEKNFNKLKKFSTNIIYQQADISKYEDVKAIINNAKSKFSRINGVIHSAGVNKDAFIFKKTKEEIREVIEPKINGALYLDQATKAENLDLFVMFSSIASVTGNIGQGDYAYANHFLDSFAQYRDGLRQQQKRYGKTLSINWPYWKDGGMAIAESDIDLMNKEWGVAPLSTEDGIQFWEDFLKANLIQGIALYGDNSKIKTRLAQKTLEIDQRNSLPEDVINFSSILDKTKDYLKKLIGEEIKLSPGRIDTRERFESFGIDSIIIGKFNVSLENDLGALSKTLFYEYETIDELADYLHQEVQEALVKFFNLDASSSTVLPQQVESNGENIKIPAQIMHKYVENEPIAIIGQHGIYPKSNDTNKFWENLKQGKNLVDLIPSTRWDYKKYYDPNPDKAIEGKIYCKWGGFLDNVDKFDAKFFNISPEEARMIDPQERIFLQSVWTAIEDAGYTRERLKRLYPKSKSANVGVFVGVTTNSYHLLGPEEWQKGNMVIPASVPWSIANRVSYFFDFQGPSMPVDTACSSSLVAIDYACESLKKRDCQVAVAGGVNLYLHQSKYQSFCQRRMVSVNGKTCSFGAGEDGFVPSEGVGTLVLKVLSKAIEDRDPIYAVIRGSGYDHSGRSNGYSAPNPNSQASLIDHTLIKANISPETIGYVEGHGTGTQLGDSLEIAALTNVFQKYTSKKQFCSVGSVKSNIGHPEAVAGIAGITKILLQFRHKQIVPSIHSDKINPNIDFTESPFYLQHKLTRWESSTNHPRRAMINSFGSGGVNACVILEEFRNVISTENGQDKGQHLFIFSAKNSDRLVKYVNRFISFINRGEQLNLTNLSYTLQIGRESMQERLAIIASNREDLIALLNKAKSNCTHNGIYRKGLVASIPAKKISNKEDNERLVQAYKSLDLSKLAEMWISGVNIDWEQLYSNKKPSRITIPTYPFAKERYWVSDTVLPNSERSTFKNLANQLHPLISYNSSTLREVSFNSLLSNQEFYAQEHRVNEQMIFPGSGFLEIACAAGNMVGEKKVDRIQDIVWIHPLNLQNRSQSIQISLKPIGDNAEYIVTSYSEEFEKIVHSEGKIYFQSSTNQSTIEERNTEIQLLKDKCSKSIEPSHYYKLAEDAGFKYGPAFRLIQELYIGDSCALSKLQIADHLKSNFYEFILHPSIIDGALQTVACSIASLGPSTPHLPFAIEEVEIVRALPHSCYAYVERTSIENDNDVKKFNIKILNEKGYILINIKNFCVRAFNKVNDIQQKFVA